MNNLDEIFQSMRTGVYGLIVDTKGKDHVGIINAIMREDGSGNKWIVTITAQCKNENVFIYAN